MKRSLTLILATVAMTLVLYAGGALLLRQTGVTSIHAYLALGLGLLFSGAIGGGLMALAFHSSRAGYDDDIGEP
jgi:hypothetical protein